MMTGSPPKVSERVPVTAASFTAGRKAAESRVEAGAQGEGAGHLPAEPRGRLPAAVHAAGSVHDF